MMNEYDPAMCFGMIPASKTSINTINKIRKIVDKLQIAPNPSLPLINVALGDPAAYEGLEPPKQAIEAVCEAAKSGRWNAYAPSQGHLVAREAIAQRYSNHAHTLGPDDVVITSACSGALEMAIGVVCDRGDSILIPCPGFPLYHTICGNKDVNSVEYPLLPQSKWEIDLEAVEERLLLADRDGVRIKAWIINNPSNPCGSVYSQEHLQACKRLAYKHRILIIADEIYEDIVFEGNQFVPLSSLAPAIPMLSVGGLAKRFLVPGWRIGWILICEPPVATGRGLGEESTHSMTLIRAGLASLATLILGACTLVQGALSSIFTETPRAFHQGINAKLQSNALLLARNLQNIPGINFNTPQGTFYLMVQVQMPSFPAFTDDIHVCEELIREQSVVCLPGTIFGMPSFIRLVYCADEAAVGEVARRMGEFFRKHHKVIS